MLCFFFYLLKIINIIYIIKYVKKSKHKCWLCYIILCTLFLHLFRIWDQEQAQRQKIIKKERGVALGKSRP